MDQLRYNSLSVIYLQIFTIDNFQDKYLDKTLFSPIDHSIDKQIFFTGDHLEKPVERYRLPGFKFQLTVSDPFDVFIEGEMYVEVSVFFNQTISITYRMLVDGKACRSSRSLTTDHLISLAALNLGAEHWNYADGKAFSTINLKVNDIKIKDFHISEVGEWVAEGFDLECQEAVETAEETCCANATPQDDEQDTLPCVKSFEEVQKRYKLFVAQGQEILEAQDMNYVYLDVWHDIEHTSGLFTRISEPDIITHINEHHKQELVGIMSLYPFEWPYRTEESFDDVCGYNIAIDTDDLILANANLCIVFGTYGRRGAGSPTDWQEHLKERDHYHVSWPEYLLIMEMILAKKYTIGIASELYSKKTLERSTVSSARELIEKNAKDNLKITRLLLKLDAVKYSRFISHKVMFERTCKRLEVDEEMAELVASMKTIDKSLYNISEMRKLKQSKLLNNVLFIISVASLFGILFQQIEMPFLQALGWHSMAGKLGLFLMGFTLVLIVACFIFLVKMTFRNEKL